jgi:hypothetical protein
MIFGFAIEWELVLCAIGSDLLGVATNCGDGI